MKPSDDLIVSSAEPTGANRKKVWIQKGNNLFNSEIIVSALSSTGEVTSSTTRLSTDRYIEVKSSTNYTLSVSEYNEAKGSPKVNIVYYDDSKNFISTSSWWNNYYTFTTPNTCKYIKITFYLSNSTTQTLTTSDVSKVQLEQGSTSTDYGEYIEPKIYVKNGNNIYEEFIKKDSRDWNTLNSTYNLRYRKINDDVEISLLAYNSSNFEIASNTQIILGTLPENFRPDLAISLPVYTNKQNLIRFQIKPDGTVLLFNWGSTINVETINAFVKYTV